MSWTQPQPIVTDDGQYLERIVNVNAFPTPNGEAVITYIAHDDRQMHVGYVRENGSFYDMGIPFPNIKKEDSGGAWTIRGGIRSIAAVQVGLRGIDNMLYMAERREGWADLARLVPQHLIHPPVAPAGTPDSTLRDRLDRLERDYAHLEHALMRVKSELRQAASDLLEAANP